MKRLGAPKEDAMALLHLSFLGVDQKLLEYQYEGCTATVVLVWRHENNRYLQAANVGDSAAFMKYVVLSFFLSIFLWPD